MGENLPAKGGSGGAGWISKATYEAIRRFLARPEVVLDVTQFEMTESAGRRHYRLRPLGKGDSRSGSGVGRFVPSIGGAGGNELFVSPGTVTYLKLGVEELDASEELDGFQTEPVFPKIDGVSIAEEGEEQPSFSLAGKANCAVWLRAKRVDCTGSVVPTGEDEEELLLVNKGAKPPKEKGFVDRLLFEAEFATSESGVKTFTAIDQRIASDVEVWYECESEEMEESDSDVMTSSELDESGGSDVPDSGSSSHDCPWRMDADWMNQGSDCAPHRYNRGKPTWIYWKIQVGIRTLKAKCNRWEVHVSLGDGGLPRPYQGQTAEGTAVVQRILSDKRTVTFGARFFFPLGVPACADGQATVTLVGYPDPEDTDPDPCCKRHAKRVPFRWKPYCGETCTTTVVPPP